MAFNLFMIFLSVFFVLCAIFFIEHTSKLFIKVLWKISGTLWFIVLIIHSYLIMTFN